MPAKFFKSGASFRAWLEKHHDRESELLVGFYKRGSARPSITWPESVDAALSYGWIDGIRKRIDGLSYSIRFTPRRAGSIWSAVNIRRARELTELGLMHPAGLRAFEQRIEDRSRIYSYEQRPEALPKPMEKQFRAKKKAWAYFCAQPPSYRRVTIFWVVSAKKEETRARRLATLIEDSARQRRIGAITLKPKNR